MACTARTIIFCVTAILLSCHASVIPENKEVDNVGTRVGMFNEYYAYTRTNFRNPVQVLATAESIVQSPIALFSDTVIIVHGLNANAFSSLNDPIKNAYMALGEFNVITVDWSIFANQPYSAAAAAVPRIGLGLAEFIDLLVAGQRVILGRLHLVGFGLGAHIVGIAGRNVNGSIARITGLDPAGEGWGDTSQRLTTSDASYVEVIHTDGFGTRANGIGEAIGHVDFFANGGSSSQPGCSNNACSHNRAWELFEASVASDHLVGSRCETLALMSSNRCIGPTEVMGGNEYVKWSSGIYRVNTGRVYPY